MKASPTSSRQITKLWLALLALVLGHGYLIAAQEPGMPPSDQGGPDAAAMSQTSAVAPSHTSLVDDFEDPTNTTLWGGQRFVGVDNFGSVISPNPFEITAGGCTPSAGNAGCISGSEVFQNAPVYPYAFLALELVNGGAAYGAQEAVTDVTPYSPNQGLVFSYRASVPKIPYFVRLTSNSVVDGGYYDYDFTPPDARWHSLVVYFPTLAGAKPAFAQPAWCKQVAFDPTQVGSILFGPVVHVKASKAGFKYGLCVDNVSFAAPPYAGGKH